MNIKRYNLIDIRKGRIYEKVNIYYIYLCNMN